jgi:MarR family transcriptional regulator, organic hydroperoxide resistance regulator
MPHGATQAPIFQTDSLPGVSFMPRKSASSSAPTEPALPASVSPLSVLQRFRVLIRTAQRHSQWIERQSGVTGAQLWALQELFERPGLRVGELANLMALHQSTASNMVDRLETAELVRKERTAADQRVVRLYLTDKGNDLLAAAPSPARGVLPEALRMLAEDDLARLQGDLDVLLRQIKTMDDGFGMQPLPFTE